MKKALLFMAAGVAIVSSSFTVVVLKVGEHLAHQTSTPDTTENVSGVETKPEQTSNLPIQFLEKPVSYEGKEKAIFQVFQIVAPDAALALESEYEPCHYKDMFSSKVVLIIGKNLYCDKIVAIDQPKQVGVVSYPTKYGDTKTVPVVR